MSRADLLKRLFAAYQLRNDKDFRLAASELIADERKKHHDLLANELSQLLSNGTHVLDTLTTQLFPHEPVPVDPDRKTPLLHVRRPERYREDLVLATDTANALDRITREFASSEVLEAHGLAPVRRVLFCGPPGCGKTVSAEMVATELGLPLVYVRFDAVVSSLLGETAANIRKVFEFAARGQWVLFFDEFDAIGRSRDDATEHGEIKRVVNSFLQLLDNFQGKSLVIAATNFEQALDPAVWRRFDDVVRFTKPDNAAIAALVRKRLGGVPVNKKVEDELLRLLRGASHADVERVCIDIRKSCALAGSVTVRREDLKSAMERWKERRSVMAQAAYQRTPAIDDK